jgi:hypothetical protein
MAVDPAAILLVPHASTEVPQVEGGIAVAPLSLNAVKAIVPTDKDFPEIISPKPTSILWTTESFEAAGTGSLSVIISHPVLPKDANWTPIMQAKGRKKLTVALRGREGYFVQNLDFSQIKLLATAGADAEKGEIERQFSKKGVSIQLRSFADLPESGLLIRLSKISPRENTKSPWITQSTERTPNVPKIEIALKSKSDLQSLFNVLKGDESFEIDAGPKKLPDLASYFVRDGAVMAKVTGRKMSEEEIRSLIKIFGAEFAFFGREAAYLSQVRDFFALKSRIKSQRIKSDIYVYDGGNLVPLKTNLLQKDPKAISTLFDGVSAFFREKVVVTDLSH